MKLHLHQTGWRVSLVALALFTIICSSCAPSNNSPLIKSLQAEEDSVTPLSSCELRCVAFDADGDSLTYAWSASGGSLSAKGSAATWVAPEITDTYTITVRVMDGSGSESISWLNIKVVPKNNLPIIENLIVTSEEPKYLKQESDGYWILKGKSCDIECVASDSDGDELVYKWSADGGGISGEEPVTTWTAPLRSGEVTIAVTVSDGSGGVVTKSIVFSVKTCSCAFK